MMIFTLILALAFAVVAVVFALANPEIVTISFFGAQMEGSLALFILVAVALGILIGVLLMTPGAIKAKLALANQKKKLKGAEKELDLHKSKVTELETKEKEKIQVVAEARKSLDEAAK